MSWKAILHPGSEIDLTQCGMEHMDSPVNGYPGSNINWYQKEAWLSAYDPAPTTMMLVPEADATHVACFLTGVGGAWGRLSNRASRQPNAKIYKDGTTGAIMFTVTPTGISWPAYIGPVKASAACIDLLP